MNKSREEYHKEYIENMGYTIQSRLSDGDRKVTYHVERGTGYAMQFVRLFRDKNYVSQAKETLRKLKDMTQQYSDLFVQYYAEQEVPLESEYETELMLQIQYAINLKRYCNVYKMTLRELLCLGTSMVKALEICKKYNITYPSISFDNVFFSDGKWKLGGFEVNNDYCRDLEEIRKQQGLPPEYYKGAIADDCAMVYEIGILMYQLTNLMEMPFLNSSQSRLEAEERRRSGETPPCPQFGTEYLKKIIQKACSCREERYPNFETFFHELECLMNVLPKEWMDTEVTGHSYRDYEYIKDYNNKENDVKPGKPDAIVGGIQQEKPDEKKGQVDKKKQEKILKKKKKEQEKALLEAEKKSKKEEAIKYKNQNKKDALLIVAIIGIFAVSIILTILLVNNSRDNRIYKYIESSAYGSAIKELDELYEAGENIDEVTVAFIDACMAEREYKRIPRAIEWLSEEYCENHKDKLVSIVEEIISAGKEKRVEEILATMIATGGCRELYAYEIMSTVRD